jgi:DNA repair protein SbcD/Mre11
MKFIHAADIHLDSPLIGLAAYPDAPAETLRSATRTAFTRLVDAALEHAVNFMIIAGDLYDGNWKDHNTGIFFCQQMGRLQRANIPVFLLYGNHDAESEMTKKLHLPDNVHVFGSRKPETIKRPDLGVALHGQSFKEAATQDNLALNYPPPVPNLFNIGVLHTALEGFKAHANYAPCSLEQLRAKGYQYWALGHVHEYKIWTEECTIVFPGNLQGRHIRETGAHGAVLVTLNDDGQAHTERLLLDVLRWHLLQPDLSACNTLQDVVATLRLALADLISTNPAELAHAVRINLQGKTAAHAHLFGQESLLRAESLALVAALDNEHLWIEKVSIATSAPDDGNSLRERADALSELQTILEQASRDPEFLKSLQTELLPLLSKAPHELQNPESHNAMPYFDAIRSGQLQALIDEVHPRLITYLAHLE